MEVAPSLMPDNALVHEFGGKSHPPFRFACIPCGKEVPDWLLDKLPRIGFGDLASKLNERLSALGADEAFLPGVYLFNGKIIPPGRFLIPTNLTDVCVRRSATPADGTWLAGRGRAVILSSGGCPIIVATHGEKLVVAHAGEKSLFDYELLTNNIRTRGRPHGSVVDSVLEALEATPREKVKKVQVWVFYSIDKSLYSHDLNHPRYRVYNRALHEVLKAPPYNGLHPQKLLQEESNLHLDLPGIIAWQFIRRGVPWQHINKEYSQLPVDDWLFPTTRAERPEDRSRRYLCVAVRL